ncbi:alpha/beta hydrolase [uncultured Shewanella sp.]|uniref:alpha/beta hydrolase n=1 Tax=uncultured Shewanella sp. TaxID=173975 RepID=UPI002605C923|nr:alpha/beta hydrolase [uncultured Shewanella sp.]
MDSVLELGIDQLVQCARRETTEPTVLPSIAHRRQGYIDSTELAGVFPLLHHVFETKCNGVPVKVFKPYEGEDMPIVVYFHGGCFVSGGFETHEQQLRQIAHLSGAIVIAVKYRLAPEYTYPCAHDDAFDACDGIYQDCYRWGGNKEAIILAGDSAGGHIALITSLRLRDRAIWQPIKQILIYPMLDATASCESMDKYGENYIITKAMLMSGLALYRGNVNAMHEEISPLFRTDWKGLPETHILTAEFDPLVDEGEMLYRHLRLAGVDAYCGRYFGVIHGFIQLSGISQSAQEALMHVAGLVRKGGGKITQKYELRAMIREMI